MIAKKSSHVKRTFLQIASAPRKASCTVRFKSENIEEFMSCFNLNGLDEAGYTEDLAERNGMLKDVHDIPGITTSNSFPVA